MIGGLVGIAFQTPIGAAIDDTRAKRAVVVLALAVLALGAVTIFALPDLLAGDDRQQPDGGRRAMSSAPRSPR